MPEVLEERRDRTGGLREPAPARIDRPARTEPAERAARTERPAREDLRNQIAALERRLAETFADAFPRQGIEWRVGAAGGPRLLGTGELERVRDALAYRLREAQVEVGRRVDDEQAHRVLLDEMIAAPEQHRWERISNHDLGEPGCRHWHSRPRWGLVGMLLNWWRVKLSSGCPLAGEAPASSPT